MVQQDVYYDLGSHYRPVTTSSAETQLWFDRGLRWAYSFNHEEAGRCFQRAAQSDPNCAMALWGIAYAAGPNYNKPWNFFDPQDRRASVMKVNDVLVQARKLSNQATPVEQALIQAVGARFPSVTDRADDLSPFDCAYANAMRHVYQKFSNDMDVAALFAEALMCITPHGLWNLDCGKPTGNHTVEARDVIERGLKQTGGRNHPALCHLHIHLLEMSPFPELALPAADRLRGMIPHASHMLHMPTHIDTAVGDYRRAIDSNQEAILADDIYFARETGTVQYIVYRAHYICAKLYSAMMSGRFADAMSAAEKLEQVIDDELLSIKSPPMADYVESFLGSRAHVLVRFGRWEDVLDLKLPSDRGTYCATTAIIYYTRGLAFSALGRIADAEIAQGAFETARRAVPSSRLNSIPCKEEDVLRVASAMLAGELLYAKETSRRPFPCFGTLLYERTDWRTLTLLPGCSQFATPLVVCSLSKTALKRQKHCLNRIWDLPWTIPVVGQSSTMFGGYMAYTNASQGSERLQRRLLFRLHMTLPWLLLTSL